MNPENVVAQPEAVDAQPVPADAQPVAADAQPGGANPEIEAIDAQLEALEKERMALTEQMKELHAKRGEITDAAHVETMLSGLTHSQRKHVKNVVVNPSAIHVDAHLPDTQ